MPQVLKKISVIADKIKAPQSDPPRPKSESTPLEKQPIPSLPPFKALFSSPVSIQPNKETVPLNNPPDCSPAVDGSHKTEAVLTIPKKRPFFRAMTPPPLKKGERGEVFARKSDPLIPELDKISPPPGEPDLDDILIDIPPPPPDGSFKSSKFPDRSEEESLEKKNSVSVKKELEISKSEPIPELQHAPEMEEGDVLSLLSRDKPKTIFVSLNVESGNAVKDSLLQNASCGEDPDNCGVISLSPESNLEKWPLKETVKTVTLSLDNAGYETKENRWISSVVGHFLDRELAVKIALPRSAESIRKKSFQSIREQPKGASKCGKVLKGAIPIESLRDLSPLSQSLELTLQKLVEKRERAATGAFTKEPLEQRIQSAVSIYSKAKPLEKTGVVNATLSLRGLLHIPDNFREALLLHPDGPPSENQKILDSEDKRTSLFKSLKDKSSLQNAIVFFKDKYWTVTADNRWQSKLNSKEYFIVSLVLKNCNTEIKAQIVDRQVEIKGVPIPEEEFQVCNFKLLTRVIPFFNEKGELTGIQRAFLGPNAQKPNVEKRRSKLARGLTNGASAILYGSEKPEIKVLGEGVENVLTVLEASLAYPEKAKFLGLNLQKEHSNCQFAASLGISDLIKVPLESSLKTLILIVDIDGYNMETKQTMIDTIDEFLKRGLQVKVLYAPSKVSGGKQDLNDVLTKEGIEGVGKLLTKPLEIKTKRELGAINIPLQNSLELLAKKQAKQTPENFLAVAKLLIDQGNDGEGFDYLKKASEEGGGVILGEICYEIASLFLKKRRPDKALSMYKKTVRILLKEGLDLSDDRVLSSLFGIGKCLVETKEYELALSYFGKVFQEKVKALGSDDHPGLSPLFFEFGNVDLLQKNYQRSLFNFQSALKLKEREIGDKNHPEVAKIIERIGDVYLHKNKIKDGIGFYKSAQEILQKAYRRDHHGQDAMISLKIAKCYLHQGKELLALEYYRKAFSMQENNPFLLKKLLDRAREISQRENTPVKPREIKAKKLSFNPPSVPFPSFVGPSVLSFNVLRERARNTRQVVIDLEMTGSSPEFDRITDIGCVALVNLKISGSSFQRYVNPERSVRPEAYRLTGLSQRFLEKYRLFSQIAPEFLEYIKGADLIFHGRSSDLLFLNQELSNAGIQYKIEDQHRIIDTYDIAKMVFPNEKNSLDALNRRLKLNHEREFHGGLKDALITADVYSALLSIESLVKVREA